ncbi:MAG: MarR family transcriptional regulator [Lachnospiraceae bacterium]|nr:MarR family transcriptional regulator [Lachnospiraceae bacterium]
MYNLFDTLTVIQKYKKLYEKRCHGLMKKYDLRIADLDILYYVAHSGEKNLAKDIVDEGMSKANVSKSVENLHQKGYVHLNADKDDRRCVHIEVTQAAAPIIAEIEFIRRNMGEALSVGIAENDRKAVARVMHKLCENMDMEFADVDSNEVSKGNLNLEQEGKE